MAAHILDLTYRNLLSTGPKFGGASEEASGLGTKIFIVESRAPVHAFGLFDVETDVDGAEGPEELAYFVSLAEGGAGDHANGCKRDIVFAQFLYAAHDLVEGPTPGPVHAVRVMYMFRPVDTYANPHKRSFNKAAPVVVQ